MRENKQKLFDALALACTRVVLRYPFVCHAPEPRRAFLHCEALLADEACSDAFFSDAAFACIATWTREETYAEGQK